MDNYILKLCKSAYNSHWVASDLIERLVKDNEKLKKRADYWETKAGEYKALLENLERIGAK